MAKGKQQQQKTRLIFTGLDAGESPPQVQILATGRDGKVTARAAVGADGGFDLSKTAIANAHRVLIGPAGQDPSPGTRASYARYRPGDFQAALDAGDVAIAPSQWKRWTILTSCVSGHVRVCRRPPWWFDDLAVLAETRTGVDLRPDIARIPAARSVQELLGRPYRCSPVCNGRVEVFRRVCCCEPWTIDDPRFDDLLPELEGLVPPRPPLPDPPPPPFPDPPRPPGPDPVDFGRATGFFRDGALDERAVFAQRDLAVLRSLPGPERVSYVNARPYLRCRSYSCTEPIKVGEGNLSPDGRFNVCWLDFARGHRAGCHAEYAYVVRQRFGLGWLTVYNGLAANAWFEGGEDAALITYHPLAFGCRENGEPGTGAFVYLDTVAETSSHELETPPSTGWDRVAGPNATSGLVFPAKPDPLDRHRNWAGTLKLNYMFSEDLRLVGAKYYRLSVTAADGSGDPIGTRHYYSDGLSWTKSVATATGVDVVPVALGPNPSPIGGQNHLYLIPYDTEADWEGNQFHAHLDTTDVSWANPAVRHLVTLEVFDEDGKRLRPSGTPATGQGDSEGTAGFTFRRKTAVTGPTDAVPFGALTHLFWWDNRPVDAKIVKLVQDGLASNEECQFLVGQPDSRFGVRYFAYHPEELFHRNHRIWWKRGLSGGSGDILDPGLGNVGAPPDPADDSPMVEFSDMLEGRRRCAFTVFLRILNKGTDGDYVGYYQVTDSAAFALELDD